MTLMVIQGGVRRFGKRPRGKRRHDFDHGFDVRTGFGLYVLRTTMPR